MMKIPQNFAMISEQEEEKKYGVDAYQYEAADTGNTHCLQAYLDFRAQAKPQIMPYMMSFSS